MKTIILGIILAMASFGAFADCKSDGYRTGIVQKFSKKGTFAKSWEGELVMQGEKSKLQGNIWKFSTTSATVANDLEKAIMTQDKVVVKYCEGYFTVSTDTNYDVVMVAFPKQ